MGWVGQLTVFCPGWWVLHCQGHQQPVIIPSQVRVYNLITTLRKGCPLSKSHCRRGYRCWGQQQKRVCKWFATWGEPITGRPYLNMHSKDHIRWWITSELCTIWAQQLSARASLYLNPTAGPSRNKYLTNDPPCRSSTQQAVSFCQSPIQDATDPGTKQRLLWPMYHSPIHGIQWEQTHCCTHNQAYCRAAVCFLEWMVTSIVS